MQKSILSTNKCVYFCTRRLLHQTAPVLKQKKPGIPKGGPVPPDYPTCAYWKLPEHLDPQRWNYIDSPKSNLMVLRYFNWVMQRDARRRETSTYYGPLRNRLNCLRKNKILPVELKDIATEEINRLPIDSSRIRVVDRCVVSSRPRGNKNRWQISRMVWRKLADHGKMSGMERAFW